MAQLILHRADILVDRLRDRDGVAAAGSGNRDAQAGLAVCTSQRGRGSQGLRNRGYIAQLDRRWRDFTECGNGGGSGGGSGEGSTRARTCLRAVGLLSHDEVLQVTQRIERVA